MLIYATIQVTQPKDPNNGMSPVRVLLVSDCIENFPRLKALLQLSSQAITYVQRVEELERTCQESYDVVVVDVGAEHIVYALREIRASTLLQSAAVLVRAERLGKMIESASIAGHHKAAQDLGIERLAQERALTSIFTKYHALPILDTELAELMFLRMQEKSRYSSLSFSREQATA